MSFAFNEIAFKSRHLIFAKEGDSLPTILKMNPVEVSSPTSLLFFDAKLYIFKKLSTLPKWF